MPETTRTIPWARRALLAAALALGGASVAIAAGQEVAFGPGAPAELPGPVVPLLAAGDGPPPPPDVLRPAGPPPVALAGPPGALPPPPFMAAPPPPGPGLDALLLAPRSGAQVLDAAEARRRLEHALAGGNPGLKVGSIAEKNEDTLVADIVTAEGSGLVRRLAIDRHTWLMRAAD
ncbi:hypothetical protein [Zavarzinia sp. CC-PAN008]|uniref:hypothetical protein n=1 Tax=Zavarzinia sp. CC-PAN008 TaxID=3243332 RepID=UPI003F745E36